MNAPLLSVFDRGSPEVKMAVAGLFTFIENVSPNETISYDCGACLLQNAWKVQAHRPTVIRVFQQLASHFPQYFEPLSRNLAIRQADSPPATDSG